MKNCFSIACLFACSLQAGSVSGEPQQVRIADLLAVVDHTITVESAEPEPAPATQMVKAPPPQPEKLSATVQLDESEVLAAIRTRLLERFPLQGELVVQFYRSWYPIAVSTEGWDLHLSSLPGDGLATLTTARLQIESRGKILDERRVTLVCELWQDVLVPVEPLTRTDTLSPGNFEVQRVDALKSRSALVLADTPVKNYELKQAASVGQPLLWRNLTARPLVRKGQVVEVRASEGLVTISMRGYALEDGAEGQFISIRNLSSRKDFQAQVINESTVKVYF